MKPKFDETLFRIFYKELVKLDPNLTDGLSEDEAVGAAKIAFDENIELARRLTKK